MDFGRIGFLTIGTAVLTACSMSTTISARPPAASLQVREKAYSALPATDRIKTTTFGNYEFKAEKAGAEPFFGILPLKFNGGYLTLDILFFAPGTFYNLRGVFPEYEIDVDEQVIRYRSEASGPWVDYKPTPAETARARRYFETDPVADRSGG